MKFPNFTSTFRALRYRNFRLFFGGQIGVSYTLLITDSWCVIGAMLFARQLLPVRKLLRPFYVRMGTRLEVNTEIQSASQ